MRNLYTHYNNIIYSKHAFVTYMSQTRILNCIIPILISCKIHYDSHVSNYFKTISNVLNAKKYNYTFIYLATLVYT